MSPVSHRSELDKKVCEQLKHHFRTSSVPSGIDNNRKVIRADSDICDILCVMEVV
jgi:hypothetical protein